MTVFLPDTEQRKRLMQGHDFSGALLPDAPTVPLIVGSGGLYSTADDILRWIAWHLDRFAPASAEMRLLDHAAYVQRDDLNPVFGLDESGRMDAMSLGWVVMMPTTTHPLILQKPAACKDLQLHGIPILNPRCRRFHRHQHHFTLALHKKWRRR